MTSKYLEKIAGRFDTSGATTVPHRDIPGGTARALPFNRKPSVTNIGMGRGAKLGLLGAGLAGAGLAGAGLLANSMRGDSQK